MWLLTPIISAFALTVQDPGLDQRFANLPLREVATDQQRSASGRCGQDEVGVVWSALSDTPSLRTVVNGRQIDLSASHPDLAAFAGAGGVQRAYLVCRPDDTIEVTLFRGLAAEEGQTLYASQKFTFDRTGHVAGVFPVHPVSSEDLRSWHR